MSEAKRYNKGKPQLSYPLSARFALEGVAEVMEFGAKKYDRDNWKKGLPLEQVLDSLLRHLTKLLDGETIDEESGCHHLDLLATNALFAAYHHNGKKIKYEAANNPVAQPVAKGGTTATQFDYYDLPLVDGSTATVRIGRSLV